MTPHGYVCILDTPVRPHFDAACSILRHEGIPFQLRETRTGLVPYVTRDELRIFVPAQHADEANELMALLEQPAVSAYTPYRDFDQDDADADADETPHDRTRGAIILLTLAALAVVAVTIGLVLSYRERLARSQPRVTTPAAEWGATTPAVLRGR